MVKEMEQRQAARAGHAAAPGLSANGGGVLTGGGEGGDEDARCALLQPASHAGPRRLTYEYKDVAFATYGDHVREMRKLFILELLSMRRVQAAWDAREAQVDKLVENLTRAGPNPVALNDHIFSTVDLNGEGLSFNL
ncbi:4-hydroxyphenylacetaldehyde oxime monooxygenase [Dichanthelium oligosanthes]|uniref:4-hydroxyphenylacetaldehyde oxime monooxygenase n=1 Tax=Dichanthelium oligosanthes TaxID=888268 RepID=A0A1E5VG27_9POAL|nr:4-hydroxyphenylacetaldehyde oxime monooxygenase [Dichanthelium oligosanthes]